MGVVLISEHSMYYPTHFELRNSREYPYYLVELIGLSKVGGIYMTNKCKGMYIALLEVPDGREVVHVA